MNNTLIINARKHLGWHRRIASDAGTAVLWAFWLWLCRPAMNVFNWTLAARFGLPGAGHKLLAAGAAGFLEGTAVTLVGTSGALLIWNRLTGQRRRRTPTVEIPDYASHFGISANELTAARSAGICVLHHDDSGRIVRLETRQS